MVNILLGISISIIIISMIYSFSVMLWYIFESIIEIIRQGGNTNEEI